MSNPLARNKLFRGTSAEVLEHLIRIPDPVTIASDEVIVEEGGAADYLYLIVHGTVRVSKRGRGEKQETLSYLGPGDFFGEMSLWDLEPRSARAEAVGEARLGRVDQAGFAKLLQLAPVEISMNITREVVHRLRDSNEQFIDELLKAERLSLIGSMAAAIAHDFNNPLSNVVLATDLIEGATTDDLILEQVEAIRQSTDQMVLMTQELLDYVRGISDLRLQAIPVSTLLDDLDEQILGRLEQSGIAVERRVDLGGEIRVDRGRFVRGLVNLAKNAGEAMGEGGRLVVEIAEREDQAVFTLRDTGPGIPDEVLPTVFEPFVKHDKIGGAGLGMAIARSVIEAHRGQISILRTSGHGTTIEVSIPKRLSTPPVVAGPAE